eukprot:3652162-Karenia_brevis.AAC.1
MNNSSSIDSQPEGDNNQVRSELNDPYPAYVNPIPFEFLMRGLGRLKSGKGTCSDGLNSEVARNMPLA